LSVRVTPDGTPVAVDKTIAVDETQLTPGPMTYHGDLNVDFGQDGMGNNGVAPDGYKGASGSLLGGALTSGGVPVTVTQTANGFVGKAGGADVFTLVINKDGTYSFPLHSNIDHKDSTDPNDIINLPFGVTITDADGDQ